MSLRQTLKSISILRPVINFLKRTCFYRHFFYAEQCRYDRDRFYRYSGAFRPATQGKLRCDLLANIHSLERSFTMPDFEFGHGGGNILKLIGMLNEYASRGYSMNDFEPQYALGIIGEYRAMHAAAGVAPAPKVQAAIDEILTRFPVPATQQPETTDELFWSHNEDAFPTFAASRHCVREYAGAVPEENVLAAVDLACTAPSACNRQYTKVHFYNSKEEVQKLLALQVGNQGFGHLAEQLLIITTDLTHTNIQQERFDAYTNAGLFLMNLCYALHYHKIAYCLLNWSTTPESDRRMRAAAGIPDNENIVLMLTVGCPPHRFKHALSRKKTAKEVCTVHR